MTNGLGARCFGAVSHHHVVFPPASPEPACLGFCFWGYGCVPVLLVSMPQLQMLAIYFGICNVLSHR